MIIKLNDKTQTLNFIEKFVVYRVLENTWTNITWNGAGESFSQQLNYGALTGNIDQIGREFGTFTYGHDNTDQLTSVAYAGSTQLPNDFVNRTFDYDYAGNRATDTANGTTKSARNIILENDKHKFFPDQDGLGRIWQKSSKTQNQVDLFSYRTDGRMIGFKRYDNSNLSRDVNYYHDALGRRVAKEFLLEDFTQTFCHLIDQDKVLLGQAGNGAQELLVDGQGIDEHLSKITSYGALAFTTDHLGTVINDEAVNEKKVAGTFGENLGADLVTTSASAAVRYGFTGAIFDAETDQYTHRHRTRNPNINIFNTEDPLGAGGGHLNLQQYGLNNPLIYIDPSGNICEKIIAEHTTPFQQGAIGASTVAVGFAMAVGALHAPGSWKLLGVIGVVIIYEGILNIVESYKRSIPKQ